MTKLGSALPKDDRDGLSVIGRHLVHEPQRMHAIMMIVDCEKVTTNHVKGTVQPLARIRFIEVILAKDHELAEAIMRRAMEARNGQLELDLDVADELRAAFDGIDKRTGELYPRRTDPAVDK